MENRKDQPKSKPHGERDQAERESDALMQDRRLREQDGTSPKGGVDPTTGQSDGDRERSRRNIQPDDAGQGSGEKERPVEGVGRSKTSDR
jgi:hypothetical protein